MSRRLLNLLLLSAFLSSLAVLSSADEIDIAPPKAVSTTPRLDARWKIKQSGFVRGLAFAPDGKTLAVADSRGRLGFWTQADGSKVRPLRELPSGMLSLAYAPDGKTVALAGKDGSVRLWDVGNDREVRELTGHDEEVRAVAFSPDGSKLVTGGVDQTVRVWDTANGKELHKLEGHRSWVQSVAFSPDGTKVASGSRDQSVRLWDLSTGKELSKFVSEDSQVWAIAFSPDGRSVAVGGGDNMIRFWNTATGKQTRELAGHYLRVWALAFAPDGRTLVSGSEDQTVRLWETVSGLPIATLGGGEAGVVSVTFGPRGRTVAAGDESGTVLVWDLFIGDGKAATADDLPRLWKDLGSEDAGRGYRDMARLLAAPKETVAFLAEQLRPIAPPAEGQLDKLIADLDSPRFVDRQKAVQELERLAEVAEPALRKALDAKPSLEMQRRLDDLLKPLQSLMPPPARLRALRGVQVLENIGTPEARKVLESLAGGAPEALLTQEAKGAVRRLGKEQR